MSGIFAYTKTNKNQPFMSVNIPYMDGMSDIFSTYMSFLYLTKINFNKKKKLFPETVAPDKSP